MNMGFINKIKNYSKETPIIIGITLIIYFQLGLTGKTISPDAYLIIPYLESIQSLQHYLSELFCLKTFDIQPIRDLSLYLDIYFFKKWNFNSFIFSNIILWILGVHTLSKILSLEFKFKVNSLYLFLYTSYPLFAHIVSFSMARKHLLAFDFTLLATLSFLRYQREKKNTEILKILIYYFLGIFSQPICLLLPLWMMIYLKIKDKNLWSHRKLILPSVALFFIGFGANYIYYSKSELFNFIFASKTKDLFSLIPKFSAFAHYNFSLFFPFKIVFYYNLLIENIVLGGLFFFSFVITYLLFKRRYDFFIIWISYSLMPFFIILNTPRLLFDVYLLIPSVGFFILLIDLIYPVFEKYFKYVSIPLLIFFIWFSYTETLTWADTDKWGKIQFERAPSCNGVVRHAREQISKGIIPQKEMLQYIFNNNCFVFETQYNRLELIIFESQLLFYDQTTPLEKKEKILLEYGKINFFPLATLAAIHIKEKNFNRAISLLDQTTEFLKGTKFNDTTYDAIFDNVLLPYCQRINHQGCIQFSGPMIVKKDRPYL